MSRKAETIEQLLQSGNRDSHHPTGLQLNVQLHSDCGGWGQDVWVCSLRGSLEVHKHDRWKNSRALRVTATHTVSLIQVCECTQHAHTHSQFM